MVRIFKHCTGNELSMLIKEHLERFNVEAKFITTDGAANMSVCTRILGIVQIKCMLHGLNLGNQIFLISLVLKLLLYENFIII